MISIFILRAHANCVYAHFGSAALLIPTNMVAAVAACVALLLTSAAAAGPPDGPSPLLVPGADQVGRGYDPATGSDVGMLFSFKAQAGTQSSSLFPSHAVPSGLVVAAAPEQLGSPTTKVIGTYRSYVDMRSAQAGLPVSAAGFFALNDEAKKMQTVRAVPPGPVVHLPTLFAFLPIFDCIH